MSEQPASPSAPEHRPTSKKRLLIYAAGAIVIIAILGYCTMKSGSGGMANQRGRQGTPPVQVAQVTQADMPVYLSGLGTVTAANTVSIQSQVTGTLQRLHFKEGDLVSAGQLLAEIDPRPFQVQLAEAQGQLAKDQASLVNARADLARYELLLKQDSIARQQVDTQRSLVNQLLGSIKSDQAQIASAQLQLTYSRISAPFAGRVGLRQVDPGNLINANSASGTIVVLTQVQPIDVLFTLPESQLDQVISATRDGQMPEIEAWDRNMGKRIALGQLVAVDNQIDPATGTVKLRGRFTNEDTSLFPNQFVNIRLKVNTLPRAVIAPVAAVQHGSQGSFVWVLDKDNKVSVKQVKTGPADGERVAVLQGLSAGMRVVIDGADRLREGAEVQVVTPGKREASQPSAQRRGGKKRGEAAQ